MQYKKTQPRMGLKFVESFDYPQFSKDQLIQYVKNQENHHKKLSIKEELIALFKEYGIVFDEKYLIT